MMQEEARCEQPLPCSTRLHVVLILCTAFVSIKQFWSSVADFRNVTVAIDNVRAASSSFYYYTEETSIGKMSSSHPNSATTTTTGTINNGATTGSRQVEEPNLWDDNPRIPPWMKAYFSWHKSERERLVRFGEYEKHRYLVMRCLAEDDECGGASDRLGQLPFLVMLANQTRRLLFIYWNRPAPLEEFLVPPERGVDWRIPDEVLEDFTSRLRGRTGLELRNDTGIISQRTNAHWATSNSTLVESRFYGPPQTRYYLFHRDSPSSEPDFDQVYGDVWRIFFEPSPPVAARVRSAWMDHGLVPGGYVSAHVRAQFRENTAGNLSAVENALRCAAAAADTTSAATAPLVQPATEQSSSAAAVEVPIFLASDSASVIQYAVEYGRRVLRRPVIAVVRDDPPLHIDLGRSFLPVRGDGDFSSRGGWQDWDRYPPKAYYDTFVDLYLLSGGRCSSVGIGGYGRWATRISHNASCYIRHDLTQCSISSSATTGH